MNVCNAQNHSDATARPDVSEESSASDDSVDILPCCFLLAIIAGFAAFVAFGLAILPAIVASGIGALLGLFFACDRKRPQLNSTLRPLQK
jgi:hypothetical protein